MSILRDGKLKPGVYRIQNIVGQTYVDIQERTRELCCRSAAALIGGKGLWEFLPSGRGYTIRRLEPGGAEQFCILLDGASDKHGRSPLSVAAFPVAWRVEIVTDARYQGYEYVRFFWSTTDLTWDLADYGSSKDLTPVHYAGNGDLHACRIWKLIPVNLDAAGATPAQNVQTPTPTAPPLPPYEGNPRNPNNQCPATCTCPHQTTEVSDDESGTTVVEVTVVTTTKTTRKKYRIEGE